MNITDLMGDTKKIIKRKSGTNEKIKIASLISILFMHKEVKSPFFQPIYKAYADRIIAGSKLN
jgi:hypothetical protein